MSKKCEVCCGMDCHGCGPGMLCAYILETRRRLEAVEKRLGEPETVRHYIMTDVPGRVGPLIREVPEPDDKKRKWKELALRIYPLPAHAAGKALSEQCVLREEYEEEQLRAANLIAALESELARLTAALPKTADGVTIVPGAEVYCSEMPTSPFIIQHVLVKAESVGNIGPLIRYFGAPGSDVPYSTESAARETKEGK